MTEISLEEMKKIQLGILDNVSAFCDEHDIKYWLDGGTLIGTVRHGGYIPWDDDIDIGMLREDYNRFLSMYNDPDGLYELIGCEYDHHTPVAFSKVVDKRTVLYEPDESGLKIAVYIDIFVYDNASDSDEKVKEQFEERDRLYSLHYAKYDKAWPKGFRHKLSTFVFRFKHTYFKSDIYYIEEIVNNSKKYNGVKCNRVGNFVGYFRFTCRKEALTETVKMVFEGKQYKVPKGYDEWLTEIYGDYMKLPPLEERVSHHVYKAFFK